APEGPPTETPAAHVQEGGGTAADHLAAPGVPREDVPPAARTATSESRGANACVIEPGNNRVCVYQRAGDVIANDQCYTFTAMQVRAWPRWLVASEVQPTRIRLLDESGQTRLEIVARDTAVNGDVLRLQQGDFESLAA